MRARGDALLSLDPSPLGEVAAGSALAQLTDEVEAHREEHRPARFVVGDDRLVVYRDADQAPTILVSYVDDTAPVDPATGGALPRPDRPRLVRETLTLNRLDGDWKVVALEREPIGFLVPAAPGQRRDDEALPLRERLDAALADAWLRLDASRLPQVLAGDALRSEMEGVDLLRKDGVVYQMAWEGAIVDPMQTEDGTRLVVDEVYLDASVWLDRRAGPSVEPVERRVDPPLYRRRLLIFEEVEGAWKCVRADYQKLGPALS
jgi:hypothetical protein